jgi:hypothetical protein
LSVGGRIKHFPDGSVGSPPRPTPVNNDLISLHLCTNKLPQDRSVISRHLALMEKAGVLKVIKEGRHVIYVVDGAGTTTSGGPSSKRNPMLR